MKKIYLIYSILMLISAPMLFAQGSQVSGVVSSGQDMQPLPGVNVVIKGTASGTVTDADGKYTLSVPEGDQVLVFSFVGFASQETRIEGRSTINVALIPEISQLGEVIVTGYGERAKSTFTGSAASIGSDLVGEKPFANFEQALQGNVAGVQLTNTSGTPGSIQNIRIRGISSITAGNAPLYVIDGVAVVDGANQSSGNLYGNLGVMSAINGNDIESITVLKDAAATALYGARGGNGVIVITTKKGKSGSPTFTFSSQVGPVGRALPGPKMLNAPQYAELHYESRVNAGQAATIAEAEQNFPLPWDGVTDTDWREVTTNEDALTQSYDFSVRGGGEKSNYYASLGHFIQDGVNIGVNFKRTTAKFNAANQINDKLNLNFSFTGSHVRQDGQMEGNSWFGNPDAAVIFLRPIFSPYNDDGSLNLGDFPNFYNPIYQAENAIHNRDQARVMTNVDLGYQIIPNLRFTSTFGIDFLYTEELNYDPREHGDGAGVNGFSFAYTDRNFNWVWKNMLDYTWKPAEDHGLDFKLVYEAQSNKHHYLGAGGNDIAADGLYYPASVATPTYADGGVSDWAINSILGTVSYAWRNTVMLDGTFRMEGNSRFAPGYRWGSFYSLGAAWVFSNEPFLQGASGWLDASKLRASYGKVGNANIPLNEYQAFLGYDANYNGKAGSYPSQLGNDQLTWENSNTWGVAVDFGVFGRVTGIVEYYHRNTYDLLMNVPLTPTSGFTNQRQNGGEMINQGWEITLNADVLEINDFKWNIGFNVATVKNKVTVLPKSTTGEEIGIETARSIVTEGEPVYSWYLPKWAGVDPQTGNPLWYLDGKGGETTSVYNIAARAIQGSTFPTLFGGLQTRFDYKGFYLSGNLYYSTGNKIYDVFAIYGRSDGRFPVYTKYASQMDRWQQPGDISENPRNVFQNTSFSSANSTRNLHSGEFLRVRDLTLGYNFPAALVSKVKLKSVNLYVRGTNLFTYVADDRLEHDPEISADALILLNAAPLKSVVGGINISF